MNPSGEKFHKTERLCNKKIIESLFTNGQVIYTDILKIVWNLSPTGIPSTAQAAFIVSKKLFRKAVARNLLKRRMRESYRKNKHLLYEYLNKENKQIVLLVIYRKNVVKDFLTIDSSMLEVFDKIKRRVCDKAGKC